MSSRLPPHLQAMNDRVERAIFDWYVKELERLKRRTEEVTVCVDRAEREHKMNLVCGLLVDLADLEDDRNRKIREIQDVLGKFPVGIGLITERIAAGRLLTSQAAKVLLGYEELPDENGEVEGRG